MEPTNGERTNGERATMLTSDLVLTRMYKGEVRPRYVDTKDPEFHALAEQLVEVFGAKEGHPRHELEQELKDLVGTGTDFLLHRALAKLLFDRCEFDTESPQEPEILRSAVFDAAAAAYRREIAAVDGEAHPFRFHRQEVLEEAARELDLLPEAVERGFYADLKDEQILKSWKPCKPYWLLERYNVALAQGILLRASRLEIHLTESSIPRQRELFRKIKFFQLLHRVTLDSKGGYLIQLDGPMSVFKSSGKYGMQMANFLPTLLHFEHWSLEATLEWGKKRRPATFRLSPRQGLRSHSRLTGQWQPQELAWLPEQLAKVTEDWEVEPEAELVLLGGQGVLVPDFVFHHPVSGTRVHMEVLGFWRRGALASRLQLLRKHGPENLLLAVSKQLMTDPDALEDLPGEVYLFRTAPLARKVLKHLEAIRQRS
jgi:predicted nuclease of restriction endonuclease-like RecB superfamily